MVAGELDRINFVKQWIDSPQSAVLNGGCCTGVVAIFFATELTENASFSLI